MRPNGKQKWGEMLETEVCTEESRCAWCHFSLVSMRTEPQVQGLSKGVMGHFTAAGVAR